MAFSQSFQERSASFEHMYAPRKAQTLFKKHREIEEKHERDSARMAWEHKTTLTDLAKSRILVERRGQVLYAKQRAIEDKFYQMLTQGAGDDNGGYGDNNDVFTSPVMNERPATHMGIRSNKRLRSSLGSLVKNRPQTSATNVSIEDLTQVSRPPSAQKRPVNRHTSSTVHFADGEEEEKENDIDSGTPFSGSAPYLSRKSSIMTRRSRRKSVFALTKAKKFELRNQEYKDQNDIVKEELQDKIGDFYRNLERYQAAYKRSLEPRSTDLPEIRDKDITNTEDVSGGDNSAADRFKIRTFNPFQNAAKKVMHDESNKVNHSTLELESSSKSSLKSAATRVSLKSASKTKLTKSPSHESLNSVHSHKTGLSGKSNPSYIKTGDQDAAGVNRPKSRPNIVSRSSQLSSNSAVFVSDNVRPITAMDIKKTLSIGRNPNLMDEHKSRKELEKERLKLLYLDAHGQLEEVKEKPKPKPKIFQKKSELRVDLQEIQDAFDNYITTEQTPDDMMKLVSVTMKLKHEARKKRDKSFIPFIAVRKIAMQWKGIAQHHQQEVSTGSAMQTT